MICKMANGYDAVSLTMDSYLSQNAENSIENSVEKIDKNRDKNDNKNENKNENENEMFSQKRLAAYERWQAVPHTPYKKVMK